MKFSGETNVKEIALSNCAARNILEDAGIDYCCGGGKSLSEACITAKVSETQILNLLQVNGQRASASESQWTAAPLAELTRHIRERHHQYVRDSIPRLRSLIAKIREKHGHRHHELANIEEMFAEVAREMLMHMQKEEQILFPFIDSLERAAKGNTAIEPPFFHTVKNPIFSMMKEHDQAGELVRRIREESGGYKAPSDACASYQGAYQGLQEFEEDLHLHIHLENNILFPRAVQLEAASR
jgi:regulator of cell morphogenesis and NO signaling